jgi:hypothetical protein
MGKRFDLCGTFPGVAPAGRYPAPHVDGARTFLSCGLSALAGAAVRPTDASCMGIYAGHVKSCARETAVLKLIILNLSFVALLVRLGVGN